jgi:hypothetical protein
MANLLKMADVQSILTLHARGWSRRRIARELQIDRETVGKHLALAAAHPKPAKALAGTPGPAGSEPVMAPDSKPATAPAGILEREEGSAAQSPSGPNAPLSDVPRESFSRCEPWRRSILAKLQAGLSAQRIYQDLSSDDTRVSDGTPYNCRVLPYHDSGTSDDAGASFRIAAPASSG